MTYRGEAGDINFEDGRDDVLHDIPQEYDGTWPGVRAVCIVASVAIAITALYFAICFLERVWPW